MSAEQFSFLDMMVGPMTTDEYEWACAHVFALGVARVARAIRRSRS